MRATAAIWIIVLVFGGLAGCQRSPFSQDLPRTPYQRYQLLRGEAPPIKELDSFGNPRPALRARLDPNARR